MINDLSLALYCFCLSLWLYLKKNLFIFYVPWCLQTPGTVAFTSSSVHGDSPGKNARVGCHALLQGIFPIQGSNPGLPHCGQILYLLSQQGSPRILEWIACPFSRESSQPRNQTGVSCIAVFTS